jgi:hypothetical protein
MLAIIKKHITLLFIAVLLSFTTVLAQQSTFKGGLTLGICPTQIDGDQNGGFNKLGITGGGYVYTNVSEKTSFQLEMNYIQKGSKKKSTKTDFTTWAIRLNYIEIPLIYKVQHKKLYYQFGLSYARLINQKFIDLFQKNEDQFKKQELAYNLGLSYPLSDKLIFETRYSRSLIPVRDKAYLLSWFGVFGGSYNSVLQFTLKFNFVKDE